MNSERVVILLMIAVNGVVLAILERMTPPGDGRTDRRRPRGPNLALTGLLVVLNVAFERGAVAAGMVPRGDASGPLAWWGLPGWARVVAAVVALDGVTYVAHVLMHKLPPAWRFHRVHHTDAYVDVTTAFRQHPLETLWRYSFLFAGALALGASSRAMAVYLALSALSAQFEHVHLSLPARSDRAVRLLLSTPAMHRVHHSRRRPETDTNYSNIFSFWDRLFGTYRAPRAGEAIECGLDGCDGADRQRTAGLLALPFEAGERAS